MNALFLAFALVALGLFNNIKKKIEVFYKRDRIHYPSHLRHSSSLLSFGQMNKEEERKRERERGIPRWQEEGKIILPPPYTGTLMHETSQGFLFQGMGVWTRRRIENGPRRLFVRCASVRVCPLSRWTLCTSVLQNKACVHSTQNTQFALVRRLVFDHTSSSSPSLLLVPFDFTH